MDCAKGMQYIRDNSVNHTITSPPYNRKRNDKYTFYNDTIKDFKTFLGKIIDELLRVTKGYVFFNIQKNFYNKEDVFYIIGKYSKYIIDIIVWNKSNPMPASGFNVTNSYEFILVMSKNLKSIKSNNTYTKNFIETNAFTTNKYSNIHKAVMNPKVCYYLIENFTKENDIILDPFMGIGTTAISALEFDRRFIGFELEKKYYDVIKQRVRGLL